MICYVTFQSCLICSKALNGLKYLPLWIFSLILKPLIKTLNFYFVLLCAFLNAKPAELFLMLIAITVIMFNWIPCWSFSAGFLSEVNAKVNGSNSIVCWDASGLGTAPFRMLILVASSHFLMHKCLKVLHLLCAIFLITSVVIINQKAFKIHMESNFSIFCWVIHGNCCCKEAIKTLFFPYSASF